MDGPFDVRGPTPCSHTMLMLLHSYYIYFILNCVHVCDCTCLHRPEMSSPSQHKGGKMRASQCGQVLGTESRPLKSSFES